MKRRSFLAGVSALPALGVLHGCAGAPQAARRSLVMGCATEPNSFDPQFQYFGPNRQAHLPVFEPLATYGPSLELMPSLATAWKATSPTSWEVALRRGVRFHDGSPFGAQDVIFSLERAPTVPNSPSSMGVYTQAIARIVAIDDHTLRIETRQTAPLLMQDLANVPILSKTVSSGASTVAFDEGKGVVGTGPYRFVHWHKEREIAYAAFDGHWAGRPGWDRVNALLLADGARRVEALLAGTVQLIDQVPPAQIARLRSTPGITISETASNFLLYLHMDHFRERSPYITARDGSAISNPLRDPRVRKALSAAVDREAITRGVLNGSAVPANQFLPSSFDGTISELPPISYDPRAGRALLAAAGFPDGFRMTIHGTRNRYANDVEVLAAIARNFTEIGVETQAVSLPSNEFFARASAGKDGQPEFSMIQTGWAATEPSGALKGLLATYDRTAGFGSSNRGRYSNSKVDVLLKQALATVDDRQRAELLKAATRVAIVDDQAIVPLYFPTNTWAGRDGVKFTARVDSSTLPMNASGNA